MKTSVYIHNYSFILVYGDLIFKTNIYYGFSIPMIQATFESYCTLAALLGLREECTLGLLQGAL